MAKRKEQSVEVVKQSSPLDYVLWVIALALLLFATMANSYLPKYWVMANDVWVRIGVIVGSVIVALGLLYLTQQGKGFIQLLKESRIELRRVTWPTKPETISTSWQVIVVVFIAAFLIWVFDTLFSWLTKLIIG
ncbi:preprotein translocase subunit SecE [Moraxella sp. ZY21109]|nr:preprotein translocase subunit SecE [Moraxella sp. ZY210820]WLF85042.1 preprotein translocase subunit SecE [Moraxella sp. ZY210820]